MGLISLLVVTIVATVVSIILAQDMSLWTPKICEKLVQIAVGSLPKEHQERYLEEWSAHLQQTPGVIVKLFEALGFVIASNTEKLNLKLKILVSLFKIFLCLSKIFLGSYMREVKYRHLLIARIRPLKRKLLASNVSDEIAQRVEKIIKLEIDQQEMIAELLLSRARTVTLLKRVIIDKK